MKWLTIEAIKKHLRHGGYCEDEVLELYGMSAEDTILELCGRTYEEVVAKYGSVPPNLIHASLLLVVTSWQNREPYSPMNLSAVPYGNVDILIKPYIKLAD